MSHIRPSTIYVNIVDRLMYKMNDDPALRYNLEHEQFPIEHLETDLKVAVEKSRLFLNTDDRYIAVSTDGLIGEETVVEVKCPFSGVQGAQNNQNFC